MWRGRPTVPQFDTIKTSLTVVVNMDKQDASTPKVATEQAGAGEEQARPGSAAGLDLLVDEHEEE